MSHDSAEPRTAQLTAVQQLNENGYQGAGDRPTTGPAGTEVTGA